MDSMDMLSLLKPGAKKLFFFFRGPKRRKKNIEMTWPSCDIMTASQNRSKSYIGPNRSPKMLQQVLNMSEASKFWCFKFDKSETRGIPQFPRSIMNMSRKITVLGSHPFTQLSYWLPLVDGDVSHYIQMSLWNSYDYRILPFLGQTNVPSAAATDGRWMAIAARQMPTPNGAPWKPGVVWGDTDDGNYTLW